MLSLRDLENRFYRRVRDVRAPEVISTASGPFSAEALRDHKYCLLTSFRASGVGVPTPVWFGPEGQRLYVRSGAQDGKIRRIRRDSRVLVAPCTARGRPLGPPMEGRARILAPPETEVAESALRRHYGLGRRIYRVLRRRIDVAYLEIGPAEPQ